MATRWRRSWSPPASLPQDPAFDREHRLLALLLILAANVLLFIVVLLARVHPVLSFPFNPSAS